MTMYNIQFYATTNADIGLYFFYHTLEEKYIVSMIFLMSKVYNG